MSTLSLFPSQVRMVDSNGFATPEFLRALQVVYGRVGGAFGDAGADAFAAQTQQERDFADVLAAPSASLVAPDVVQSARADMVWPDVMQPQNLWPVRLAASTLLGRNSVSGGDPQQITLGLGLSMSGTTLSAQVSGAPAVFTPGVAGTTTAGTGTYITQVGNYIELGGTVFFVILLNWSAHTGTGNIKITGLPVSNGNFVASCSIGLVNGYTLTANYVMTAYIGVGASEITLQQYPAGGGGSADVAIDTAAQLAVSGFYFAA